MTLEAELLIWFLRQAGNHLWQSSAFAGAALVAALALRATHARARHWVWLAASVKFLVPFGVLASLGGILGSWVVPAAPIARIPFTVEQVVQPFALPQETAPIVVGPAPASAAFPVAAVLIAVWLIGSAVVLFRWWNRWRWIRAAVRASAPLREGREADAVRRLRSDVELVSSAARLEPGTFGVLKPVLWLPAGIADRLSEAELDAILAHELCHARRRDNLWAAVHMAVEAIFWFHPLVWWLGARLVEERERACDEEVVRLGSEPQAYAEGVLKVCEFYLSSPLACAAGMTGGELRKRIEGIMESRFIAELCFWKKLVLTALLAAGVACPFLLGVFKAEAQTAQSDAQQARFEEASIKLSPNQSPQVGFYGGLDKIRDKRRIINYTHVHLQGVLMEAYGLWVHELTGPSWLDKTFYDIVVKLPDGAAPEQIPAMLQDLLRDRFRMRAHWEMRAASGYELVRGKTELKLNEAKPDPRGLTGGYRFSSDGMIQQSFRGTTLDRFSKSLTAILKRPVSNKTGIQGTFDITFECAADSMPGMAHMVSSTEPVNGPSIFTAIRGLGLDLVPAKVNTKRLVVDSVEKNPTEN